jgi:hypothetical protein
MRLQYELKAYIFKNKASIAYLQYLNTMIMDILQF